jgi:hypothetical protein
VLDELLTLDDDRVQRQLANAPATCGARGELERLVLGAALQQPGRIRGLLFQSPALYYFERSALQERECALVRLSLPTGGPQ